MTEWLHFHFSLSCIGERNGNPLQCSCLENPRDEGTCWAAVYGVAESRTRLKRLSSSSSRSNWARRHASVYDLQVNLWIYINWEYVHCQVSMVKNTTILVFQPSSILGDAPTPVGTPYFCKYSVTFVIVWAPTLLQVAPYFCMYTSNSVVIPSRSVSVPHFWGHLEIARSPCLNA